MKEKNRRFKEFFKRYLIGFFAGIIVFGGVSVIAMTYFPSKDVIYDNSNSGMSSINVQGAIDELYNTCFPPTPAGDQILEKAPIVTTGDGLYKDENEDRYFYRGKNPNNYVTFNNETAGWRIISLESDGTIKIMRDASIGNIAWDSSNSNNWARPASLNTYLNSTYYNGLNSTAQGQIATKDFSIGAVTYTDTNLANTISNENATKWNGKVALATTSEYIRSNSNQSSCGTMNQVYDSVSCGNTSWMFNNTSWWTMSPTSGDSSYVFYVSGGNYLVNYSVNYIFYVRPALYLSAEVQITGGDGSQSNPYTLG